MIRNPKFDDIRPYYDEEINAAMCRIAGNEYFRMLCDYVYPKRDIEDVKKQICAYTTIDEFQLQVMKTVNEQVIARSITQFTYSGLDKLDRDSRYLFVSNHRDIMLDASLLQYALYREKHRTSEITFGSNLMNPQVVVDIGKSNKMFKVMRGGNMKDFYNNSLHLSEYIRYTLLEKRESVWIAQRNGRTKNGIDATDCGIIKMFCISAPENPVQSLAILNIVPVSISYEWEPCDVLKAKELYYIKCNGKYEKQPMEDLNSIFTGIFQPKGAVHIHFGNPVTENDLLPLAGLPHNRFNAQAAQLLDKQILANYRLFNTNYIAHDLRSASNQYSKYYTQEEKIRFDKYYQKIIPAEIEDKQLFGDIFLSIYANPVSPV
jgi:hypothetical protein